MLPTRQQVLEFYDFQPDEDKTPNGFAKGSDSRAAYVEWYQEHAGTDSVTTPRGIGHSGPDAVRAYALYVLERAVKARKKRGLAPLRSVQALGVSPGAC